MPLVLKRGAQYQNPSNGRVIHSPYAVITGTEGDLTKKREKVTISVFEDRRSYHAGADAIETRKHGCRGAEFDKHFSPDALLEHGMNAYKAAEEFVLSVKKVTAGPVEDPDSIPLVWGDRWQVET